MEGRKKMWRQHSVYKEMEGGGGNRWFWDQVVPRLEKEGGLMKRTWFLNSKQLRFESWLTCGRWPWANGFRLLIDFDSLHKKGKISHAFTWDREAQEFWCKRSNAVSGRLSVYVTCTHTRVHTPARAHPSRRQSEGDKTESGWTLPQWNLSLYLCTYSSWLIYLCCFSWSLPVPLQISLRCHWHHWTEKCAT